MSITAESMERLAVAQTLYKSIAEEVATASKGGQGIRAQADVELAKLWEETGSQKLDLKVQGVKVGSFSLKVSDEHEVEDQEALQAFLLEHGYAAAERTIREEYLTRNQRERLLALAGVMNPDAVADVVKVDPKWAKQVSKTADGKAVWTETGEPVPGVTVRTVPTGTTLRVDEAKVIPLLAAARSTVYALVGANFAEEEN